MAGKRASKLGVQSSKRMGGVTDSGWEIHDALAMVMVLIIA
jgi:hypothetical protein